MVLFSSLLIGIYCLCNVEAGIYCASTRTSDSIIASNPGISNLPNEATLDPRVHVTVSEIARIPTMSGYDADVWTWDRTDCPHEQTGLTTWESAFGTQSSGDGM